MSRFLILLLVAGIAHAEPVCRYRSDTVNRLNAKIERAVDEQTTLYRTRDNKLKCKSTFRALINNQWYDVEGEATGPQDASRAQVCALAMQSGKLRVLREVGGSSIQAEQGMSCFEEPLPTVRKSVGIGQYVRESEVQPKPGRSIFVYNGSRCRAFVESRPAVGDVYMSEGVICQSLETPTALWQVVDKW